MATAGKTVTVAYESPKALKRAIGKAKPLRWMRGKDGGYVSHDGVLGVYGVHHRSPNRRRGILPWPVTLRGAEIHAADTAGDAKAYAAYYDEITQKCPPVAVVAPGRPVSAFTGRVIPEGVMEHAGVSYNDRVRVCLAAMGSPSPDADVDSSRAYLEGMKRTEVSPAMAASVIFATLHHGHFKSAGFVMETGDAYPIVIKLRPDEVDSWLQLALELAGVKGLAQYRYDPTGSVVRLNAAQLRETLDFLTRAANHDEYTDEADKAKLRSTIAHIEAQVGSAASEAGRIDDDPRDLPWQDYDAFFGAARGKKFRTVVYTRKGIAIANLSRVFTDKVAARTDGYDLLSEHPNLGAFIVLDENGKQIWIGRREGFERMQNRSARRRMAQMATPDEASEERAGLRWTEISFDVRSDAAKFSRLIQKKHSEIVASHEGLIVTTNATGADIRNVLQGNTWEEGYRLGRNVDRFDLAAETGDRPFGTLQQRLEAGGYPTVDWAPFRIVFLDVGGTPRETFQTGENAEHAVQNARSEGKIGPDTVIVEVTKAVLSRGYAPLSRGAYEAAAEEEAPYSSTYKRFYISAEKVGDAWKFYIYSNFERGAASKPVFSTKADAFRSARDVIDSYRVGIPFSKTVAGWANESAAEEARRRPATTTHLTRAQVASMNNLGTPQVVSWPPFTILMQRPDGTTYKAYSAGRDANHAVQNMEGDSTVGPNDTVVSVEPYEIVRSAYEAAAEECPCPHGGEEASLIEEQVVDYASETRRPKARRAKR